MTRYQGHTVARVKTLAPTGSRYTSPSSQCERRMGALGPLAARDPATDQRPRSRRASSRHLAETWGANLTMVWKALVNTGNF